MPFELTSEPWIPVRSLNGERKEVSLRELFAKAHELECVNDASPLVTLALHRFLIAIVLPVLRASFFRLLCAVARAVRLAAPRAPVLSNTWLAEGV